MATSPTAEMKIRTVVWTLVLSFGFSAGFLLYVNGVFAYYRHACEACDVYSKDASLAIFGVSSGVTALLIAATLYIAQLNKNGLNKNAPFTHILLAASFGFVPAVLNMVLVGVSIWLFKQAHWEYAAPGLTLITGAGLFWFWWVFRSELSKRNINNLRRWELIVGWIFYARFRKHHAPPYDVYFQTNVNGTDFWMALKLKYDQTSPDGYVNVRDKIPKTAPCHVFNVGLAIESVDIWK